MSGPFPIYLSVVLGQRCVSFVANPVASLLARGRRPLNHSSHPLLHEKFRSGGVSTVQKIEYRPPVRRD